MKHSVVWFFLSLAMTGLLLGPMALSQAGPEAPSSPSSAKDFTISSSPTNLALTPGDSGKIVITLTSINGFRDKLALSATSSPTGPSLRLSTTSVTLKPDRAATSELTVSSTTSTPMRGYVVTVTATGKKVSHSVNQSVSVSAKQVAPLGDFSLNSGIPTLLTISAGTSSSALIAVTSLDGFSGNVTLDSNPPQGITTSFDPTVVGVVANGTSRSTLTISVSPAIALGTYSFNVVGTSGSLSHSVTIAVAVPGAPMVGVICVAPGESVSCPDSPPVFTGTLGSQLTVAINVQGSDSLNAFDIQVQTDPAVLQPISNSLDGTLLQNVSVVINSTDPANGIARVAATALAFFTTSPTTGRLFSITYNIVGTTGTPISFPTGCNGSSNNSFCVTVANGGQGPVPENLQTATFGQAQPDFTISASPDALVLIGPPVRSTIELTSVGNFSATVFLSLLVLAPPQIDLSTSLSPTTLTLAPGETVTSTLEVFSSFPVQNFTSPAGNFTIVITGISGSLSHPVSVTVSFAVQNLSDFSIDVQPSTLVVAQGNASAAKVVVTSIGGFTGTVSLEAAVFGDRTAPPTAFLEQSSVFLETNGTVSTFLDVVASGITPIGGYNVTVTASSGPLYHIFVGAITVIPSGGGPDFAITADPTFLTTAGQPAFSTITLQSLNSFSGTVDLSMVVRSPTQIILNASLNPTSVTLLPGGIATSTLEVFAFPAFNSTLFPNNSTIIVTGTTGSLSHSIAVEVLVLGQDIPPVAQFSFFPTSPFVGEPVQFDGSRSFDPDGFITTWSWDFGGGFAELTFSGFISHAYLSPGNYTVVLTVTDNAGLTATATSNIVVRSRLVHDVSIVSVNPQPIVAVESQTIAVNVVLVNNGQSPENVQVSVFFESNLAGTVNATVDGRFATYVTVFWDTAGVTPGNYTISATVSLATDENPGDNTLTDGQVTILPPPTLTVNPSTGSLGTRVIVHGSGFPPPPPYGPSYTQVLVTFDDMFMGFTLVENGEFDFTFSIPHAETGLHLIKAFDSFTGVSSSASFTVLAEPTARELQATVQVGAIYFPGDQADIFVLVTVDGSPTASATLEVSVNRPDGSSIVLNASMVQDGLFRASYLIPASGSEGTYAVIATAQLAGREASALGSFEVKQAWVVQQAPAIASALSLTGVLGVAAIAWRKGVFRRKEDNSLF